MPDVSITASSVRVANSNTVVNRGIAAESITAGQPVYIDSTSANKLRKARADSAPHAAAVGIAVNTADADQPVSYVVSGDLVVNAVLANGVIYVVSATAGGGKIGQSGDLTTGNYGTVLGIGYSTTGLRVGITASGVAK